MLGWKQRYPCCDGIYAGGRHLVLGDRLLSPWKHASDQLYYDVICTGECCLAAEDD